MAVTYLHDYSSKGVFDEPMPLIFMTKRRLAALQRAHSSQKCF